MTDALSRLSDRCEIQDLLARYARGVDRRDWDLVRSIFHADAHDDHGEYKGGVDGFIDWVSQRHARIEQSMHFLGNCLIEFAGDDVALVETYFIAMQRLDADAGTARTLLAQGGVDTGDAAVDVDILGRYIDRVERRESTWRIARRIVAFDSIRTRPVSSGGLDANWARSRRDENDPLVAARAALGLAERKT